jgi:hypothetical protein
VLVKLQLLVGELCFGLQVVLMIDNACGFVKSATAGCRIVGVAGLECFCVGWRSIDDSEIAATVLFFL